MIVILISGKAESGKTTAANILKNELEKIGGKAAIIPYGDYVKHTAKLVYDWDGKKDEAGRSLLQHWGTDVVRSKHENFWVDTVISLNSLIRDEFDYMIVDDVRFKNEITRWKGDSDCTWRKVISVRIERPGFENHLTEEQRNHISETDLDSFDLFDANISATDVDELTESVKHVIIPKIICEVLTMKNDRLYIPFIGLIDWTVSIMD